MPKELLLEIGSEEIPAGFITGALGAMEELAAKALSSSRLEYSAIRAMGNPRRLVLYVSGISDMQPDSVREVLGPPKSAAYDKDGNLTKAATGFAKGQGVEVTSLSIKETEKGDYLCAIIEEKGVPAKEVLSDIIPKLILSIPFPKSMRWGNRDIKFARPIHWILAILDGEVIPFEVDGVKSTSLTKGHRFMSPGAFLVKDFESYMHQTKDNYSIVDQDIRLEMVMSQVGHAAANLGATVLRDEGLLREVSYLVEYPLAVVGNFDKSFLSLPKEVLVNSMREHQRYFALEDSQGTLLPHFITISNTKAEDMNVVRLGNERVLRARLSDARFFFEEDMKKKLADRVDDLKKVLFQKELGTVYEKTQRIVKMSVYLSDALFADPAVKDNAARAALLCKADLVTGMVYEFANLQGVMGCDYARRNGEPEEVAKAIVEHYMPRFSGDEVPSTHAGAVVSIADKMDTIAGIFSIGKPPTGSEDPYALRRQALGIIAIIYKLQIKVSLADIIKKAVEFLDPAGDRATLEAGILEFFKQRVSNQLTGEGYDYDIVEAVLASEFGGLDVDIVDARNRVIALSEFRSTEEYKPFMIAFKRVANIIPDGFEPRINETMLKGGEDAEIRLYEKFASVKLDVLNLVKGKHYLEALNRIAEIRPFVDKFFDDVMVMDKDEAVKNNRLSLMGLIAGIFMDIADLKKIAI